MLEWLSEACLDVAKPLPSFSGERVVTVTTSAGTFHAVAFEALHGTQRDVALLADLPMFLRMHRLVTCAKLVRALDIADFKGMPAWMERLNDRLAGWVTSYRSALIFVP